MNQRLLTIPLTQLQRATDNVRQTGADADIAALAGQHSSSWSSAKPNGTTVACQWER